MRKSKSIALGLFGCIRFYFFSEKISDRLKKVQIIELEEIGQFLDWFYNECYVYDFFQDLRQYGRNIISYFFTIFAMMKISLLFIRIFRKWKRNKEMAALLKGWKK